MQLQALLSVRGRVSGWRGAQGAGQRGLCERRARRARGRSHLRVPMGVASSRCDYPVKALSGSLPKCACLRMLTAAARERVKYTSLK